MSDKQKAINKSITTQYNKYYQKYKKMYGEKCVVLMQVGSFFEIYGIDPDDLYVDTVCNLLNIICTRKNKAIPTVSAENPKFAGFTMVAFDKYLRVLQENQWTTVVIEQVTPPPNPKRDVTQIISPGTYIDANLQTQSNFVFSLYVEKLKQFNSDVMLNYVGLSAIDVSTGRIFVFETADTLTDRTLAAHETYRFIHSYSSQPKEVIINFEEDEDEEFIKTLSLGKFYSKQWHNDFMNKPSFQEKVFQKYYKSEIMSSIEFLDLEQHPHARISLCILFQYIYEHNAKLLERMSKPMFWDMNDYLILSHDAYEQLNLYVPQEGGLQSVFDVLNHTSTSMGARLLRDRLLHPLADIEKLEQRYDQVAYYQDKTDILAKLKTIVDLERFHRKLILGKLHPMEFVKLVQSYEIIESLKDNQEVCALIRDKLKEYEGLFNFDAMAQCKLDQMGKNFFNRGVYPEIDTLEDEKQNTFSKLDTLRTDIIKRLVEEDKKVVFSDDLVKLVKTDKEGFHLTMTKLRWQKVSKHFDYECRTMSSYVKLSSRSLRDLNRNLEEIEQEMAQKLLEYYLKFCHNRNSEALFMIHDYVAKLDVNLSAAKVANIYGYNRPKLIQRGESFVDTKDMRHPLIERINTQENYVPNDVFLGKEEKGMIITGMNALGKCFGGGTEILMYDGSIKLVEDIQVGDLLMGDDSTPRKILSLTQGYDDLYEIFNKKGDTYIVNKEHILCLTSSLKPYFIDRSDRKAFQLIWFDIRTKKIKTKSISYKNKNKEKVKIDVKILKTYKEKQDTKFTISVKDYLKLPKSYHKFLSGYKVGVDFVDKPIPIDPYLLGIWLGDGTSSSTEITTQDAVIIKYLKESLGQYNCYLSFMKCKDSKYAYRINSIKPKKRHQYSNYFSKFLSDFNLLDNKHIPDLYKINSRKNRLKILAGIIDTDGSLGHTGTFYEITQKNKKLSEDIIYLARSLGFMCYMKKSQKGCWYKNKYKSNMYYRLTICGDNIADIPVLCKRKQTKYNIKTLTRDNLVSVIDIKPLDKGKYYGFETDGNHQFLLGNFIVTHNSSMLKSIGVNVVLAQAGFFVACSSMELAPFRTILTRIEGNDDLLKGKSSFMVEMMDLKSIIERSNVNSLVLADELTKGTEQLSGLSILAASIQDLSQREVPFIYTTHLHKIKEIPEIRDLENIGYYFMRAEVTDKGITINRKLEKGFCDSLYGIEVARFILDKPEFIQQAFKIRNFLLEEHDSIVSCKTSRYNKDVYMDRCQWPGCRETKQLHTHHLKHQEHANQHGLNDGYIQKNQASNLMVLCEKHHREIHMRDT